LYILTANHVSDATNPGSVFTLQYAEIPILSDDYKSVEWTSGPLEVLASSKDLDLSLLEVSVPGGRSYSPLRISGPVPLTTPAFYTGFPLWGELVTSEGRLSSTSKPRSVHQGKWTSNQLWVFSTPGTSGASGSGILDLRTGHLLGIAIGTDLAYGEFVVAVSAPTVLEWLRTVDPTLPWVDNN